MATSPLGYAVPADFLYDQVASEIANAGLLPAETKEKIDSLEGGTRDERLRGRVLSLVYMLSQIAADADRHGVSATAEAIADLMVIDLAGDSDVRPRVHAALAALADDGAIIDIGGSWRGQTKESAEWEKAFKDEERRCRAGIRRPWRGPGATCSIVPSATCSPAPGALSRVRPRLAERSIGSARTIPRRRTAWRSDFTTVGIRISRRWTQAVATEPPTDPTVHLSTPRLEADELNRALAANAAAVLVLQVRGVATTDAGREARQAMGEPASQGGGRG